jgi:prevent-host-death family protein
MLASEPSLKIDISEAQIQLFHLLDLAIAGQEIVITQGDQPVARLVSIAPKRSLFGSAKVKYSCPMTLRYPCQSLRNIRN